MARKTFYGLLELARDASPEDIHRAFRRLALLYHPDMVVGLDNTARSQSEERMKIISEAFAVLRKPKLRELYDRCLQDGLDFALEVTAMQNPPRGDDAVACDLTADTKELKRRVLAIVDVARSSVDENDNYFDFIVEGHVGPSRYWVYGKALDFICAEDIEGVVAFADQIECPKATSLSRDYLSFVLAGRSMHEPETVKGMVERYNARMRTVSRNQPLRALVILPGPGEAPFVPHHEVLKPRFMRMPQ